ncbi:MAG: hypothetical protein R3E82_00760 [Pseudomonadales bacterium]|nr:hypothetical protein [Pseudomonadales bacterium]
MRMMLLYPGLLLAGVVFAGEAPMPAVPDVQVPVSAEAAYLTGRAQTVRIPQLDEAIFTDISPLTVPEQAIRLPEDQQE